MEPGGVDIVQDTRDAALATWRQVVVLAVREAISVELINLCLGTVNRLALAGPVYMLSILGERMKLPDGKVLQASIEALQESRAACKARVIPGQGLRPSALRGMLAAAQTDSTDTRPQAVFSTIPEACHWLAHTVGKDPAFAARLSTIAGTLMYGSPSFSRHSQVAPYLSGEDVSGTNGKASNKPNRS